MKIAFVGPSAVGKDAVSEYISNSLGLVHVSSGNLVREYITQNNLGELDRKNLQMVANMMRAESGGDVLVRVALERNPDNIVLSGLRAIDEIQTFKKMGGKVIAVTAPLERRYELAKIRRRIDDNISFENFKKIEEEEYSNKDRNGQNVAQVITLADAEVVNDGSLEQLFKKCKETVEKLVRT
jgi:dephospho-CoA kinase